MVGWQLAKNRKWDKKAGIKLTESLNILNNKDRCHKSDLLQTKLKCIMNMHLKKLDFSIFLLPTITIIMIIDLLRLDFLKINWKIQVDIRKKFKSKYFFRFVKRIRCEVHTKKIDGIAMLGSSSSNSYSSHKMYI